LGRQYFLENFVCARMLMKVNRQEETPDTTAADEAPEAEEEAPPPAPAEDAGDDGSGDVEAAFLVIQMLKEVFHRRWLAVYEFGIGLFDPWIGFLY
jgi:hypothetical protein